MRISIIAAIGKNHAIGRDNRLPWHFPEDLARFKRLTRGCPLIMGRKTWESLPENARPLPGRVNIVLTRQKDYKAPGANMVSSMEEALEVCSPAPRVFVMGGAEIYKLALPIADCMELTEVDASPKADAFFPEWGPEWEEVWHQDHPGFRFVRLEKNATES